MRTLVCSLVAGVLAFSSISTLGQQPIVVKFSHVLGADSPKGRAADFFKMRAEELTARRVKVEVYANAQLFKDGDEMRAIQHGDVQIIAPSLSKLSALGVREFEVFDIPYIFPNRAVLKKVQDGPIGKALLQKLEPQGIQGLAFWDNGLKIFSANKPLNTPSDLKGMKLRIQGSQVLDAQVRALGGTPVVMPLADVGNAIKVGQMDGTENPPTNMYSYRLYELQKYAVDTNHGYLGYALIANKRFWDGLPQDIRAALEQAAKEATRFANTVAWQDNNDALAVIEHSGKTKVIHLSDTQRKAWQQALAPVIQSAEQRVGENLIRAINRESAAASAAR